MMDWTRAARRAGGIAPLLGAMAACLACALPAAACLNDGTPAPCRCLMKMMVTAAASQSFSANSPTLSSASVLQPDTSTQTVHVGTDTSSGQTVYYYNSSSVTITAGDTVTWLLDGTEDHTVTSDLPSNDPNYFDSGSLAHDFLGRHPDGSYSVTFNTPGTYTYHCLIHDFQVGNTWFGQQLGTVTVVAAPEPSSMALLAGCAGALLRRRKRS